MTDSLPKWTRQPDKRPEQIRDAALEVFALKGYNGATMEEIAEAAGVTKGTIYLYFSGKEALFIETLGAQAERLMNLLPEFTIRPGQDIESVARKLAPVLLEALMAPEMTRVIPLFLAEVNQMPALRRAYLEEWVPRVSLKLAQTIQDGTAEGIFKPLEPIIAARALLGMFSVFALTQEVLAVKEVTPMRRQDIADTIVEIMLRGVLAAP